MAAQDADLRPCDPRDCKLEEEPLEVVPDGASSPIIIQNFPIPKEDPTLSAVREFKDFANCDNLFVAITNLPLPVLFDIDTKTWTCFEGDPNGVEACCVDISSDGKTVITGHVDGSCTIWLSDETTGYHSEKCHRSSLHKAPITHIKFGGDASFYASDSAGLTTKVTFSVQVSALQLEESVVHQGESPVCDLLVISSHLAFSVGCIVFQNSYVVFDPNGDIGASQVFKRFETEHSIHVSIIPCKNDYLFALFRDKMLRVYSVNAKLNRSLLSANEVGSPVVATHFVSSSMMVAVTPAGQLMLLSDKTQLIASFECKVLSVTKCLISHHGKVIVLTRGQFLSITLPVLKGLERSSAAVNEDMYCNNTRRPCAVDEANGMICKNCNRQVCPVPWKEGQGRSVIGPHRYEKCQIGQGDALSVDRCKNCKRVRCEKAKNEQSHQFGDDGLCVHCGLEKCSYFSRADVDASLGVHHFVDGKCLFCMHRKCQSDQRVHQSSGNYHCETCGEEMCDEFQTHDFSKRSDSCSKCCKHFGQENYHVLCAAGHTHKLRVESDGQMTCEICGYRVCQSSNGLFSCLAESNSDSCGNCGTPLCLVTGSPHLFVKREILGSDGTVVFKQTLCSHCCQFQCGSSNDVHHFNGDDFCSKCKCSKCDKTGGTHRISEVSIDGIGLRRCLDCGKVMCASVSGVSHHVICNGKCKFCGQPACKNGNVHTFSGPEQKCIFCRRTKCSRGNLSHNPVMTLKGIMCEHCNCRICPHAYFQRSPLITVCQDDGCGCCRFCGRGLCTYKDKNGLTVTGDHEFQKVESGLFVCVNCKGSKCNAVTASEYCHHNKNGYCLFCRKQLCCGNCEHDFTTVGRSKICRTCGRESCSAQDGGTHSLWKDGCCEFCRRELCVDGKRLHEIHEHRFGTKTIRFCSLCRSEVCPNSDPDVNQCHFPDLVKERCIKCDSVLCSKNESNILCLHYFDEDGICYACQQERCGSTDGVHHFGHASRCFECHKPLHNGRQCHCPGPDGLCKICGHEMCPKGDGECHHFDHNGRCVFCGGHRCTNERVHSFAERKNSRRCVCRWCFREKCSASENEKDICHFVSGKHFCICCLKVRCPSSCVDYDGDCVHEFCHERCDSGSGKQFAVCSFCRKPRDSFEEKRDKAIACQEQLKQNSGAGSSDITNFAKHLNGIFVSMAVQWNKNHPGQILPPDVKAVANLAVTWLKSAANFNGEESSILSQWASHSTPNPYAMYLLRSSNASYLRNAAFAGYSQAICDYMNEMLNQRNTSNARQILKVFLRNIEMIEDIEHVLKTVRDLTQSVNDPEMNYMLIEAYLEKYDLEGMSCDQEDAFNLFASRSLSDRHRLGLARRELRNGSTKMARNVGFDLLQKPNEREKMTGASLLCEVILRMRAQGRQWNDILPQEEELPWERLNTVPSHHIHRLWSLWKIDVHQGDDSDEELLIAFSVMKRCFFLGDRQIWYDLCRLSKQIDGTRLRLLAVKTLIEICIEDSSSSLERTLEYLETCKKLHFQGPQKFETAEMAQLLDEMTIYQAKLTAAKQHRIERQSAYKSSKGTAEPVLTLRTRVLTRLREQPLERKYLLKFANGVMLEGQVLGECLNYVEYWKRAFAANDPCPSVDNATLEIWKRLYVSLSFTSVVDSGAQEGAEVIRQLIRRFEAVQKAMEEEADRKEQEEADRKAAEEKARKEQEEENTWEDVTEGKEPELPPSVNVPCSSKAQSASRAALYDDSEEFTKLPLQMRCSHRLPRVIGPPQVRCTRKSVRDPIADDD